MDNFRRILITGGTGSLGKALIKKLLTSNNKNIERLVVFSRDELKQWDLRNKYPQEEFPQLRFFLGDIRDKQRLKQALNSVDTVIHTAALKQVPAAEYNPTEFIKTNIVGSQNLIEACFDSEVQKVIALSTDKACSPINLYGATKLCSDKLFIAANNMTGNKKLKFSIVRYGNVMGSRGSVIPLFIKEAKKGKLPLTDKMMTRFNISLEEGVNLIFSSIEKCEGGEIFVPKIPSYRINDLAEAIGPNCKKEILGIRPGEKLHEEMISNADIFNTVDLGDYYAILPDKNSLKTYNNFPLLADIFDKDFSFNSGNNNKFLTVYEIRNLIKIHVDKEFKPT